MSWRPLLLPTLLALSLVWSLIVFPFITVIAPIWGFCKGYTKKLSHRDRKDLKTEKCKQKLQKCLDIAGLPIEKMLDL